MKSTLIYSLIALCCAQPALAQHFESDEQFEQRAAKQIQGTNRVQQPVKKATAQVQHAAKRPNTGGYSLPVRHNNFGSGGYGYRPQRSSIGSSYGYRPQRSQLLPQGYSQEMLQQKMAKLQQMQQMMGGGAGVGAPGPQQGKGNILQMLMGGGAQQQQQPQQQSGQPQFNRGELLKTFFGGGGSTSEQTGE